MSGINDILIAERYAAAIINSTKQEDKLLEDSQLLLSVFQDDEVRKIFDSAVVNIQEKTGLIDDTLEKLNFPEMWKNTFKVILNKGRHTIIKTILEKLIELIYYYHMDTLRISLFLAKEQSAETIENIKQKLENILQKKVLLDIKFDRSLIGGFLAKNDNIHIDGSIKNNLIKFQEAITIK